MTKTSWNEINRNWNPCYSICIRLNLFRTAVSKIVPKYKSKKTILHLCEVGILLKRIIILYKLRISFARFLFPNNYLLLPTFISLKIWNFFLILWQVGDSKNKLTNTNYVKVLPIFVQHLFSFSHRLQRCNWKITCLWPYMWKQCNQIRFILCNIE